MSAEQFGPGPLQVIDLRPAGKRYDVAETLLAAGYSAEHVVTVTKLTAAQVARLVAARAA